MLAALELLELDPRLEDLERHRVERRLHQVAHDLLQRVGRFEVARPHAHRIALLEQRGEEGEAGDVVEMGVREIDVDVDRGLARQFEAERPDAGAGVENETTAARGDLEARGVAAIARILGAGARNRPSHAPEPDFQTIRQSHCSPSGGRVHGPAARVNRGRPGAGRRNCGRVLAYACGRRIFHAFLHVAGQFVGLCALPAALFGVILSPWKSKTKLPEPRSSSRRCARRSSPSDRW